jgi:hypothetical protein
MSRIKQIKEIHNRELEKHCEKHSISFQSIQKLLEAERSKKLLKRNALMQQNIDREIDNSLSK